VLEGFDEQGNPKLRPAKGKITLRQLLTHTSGFTYDFFNANTGRYVKFKNLPDVITGKNLALTTPLAFDPGTDWEYGISSDLAGKAVEAASGENLDVYFRKHIFEPLGMKVPASSSVIKRTDSRPFTAARKTAPFLRSMCVFHRSQNFLAGVSMARIRIISFSCRC
jgi:CubicO group peptidase (beta-lactamase class C family)